MTRKTIKGKFEATVLAVDHKSLMLKKIAIPSKENLIKELEDIAKEGKRRLQKKGLKESDIPKLGYKARRH